MEQHQDKLTPIIRCNPLKIRATKIYLSLNWCHWTPDLPYYTNTGVSFYTCCFNVTLDSRYKPVIPSLFNVVNPVTYENNWSYSPFFHSDILFFFYFTPAIQ